MKTWLFVLCCVGVLSQFQLRATHVTSSLPDAPLSANPPAHVSHLPDENNFQASGGAALGSFGGFTRVIVLLVVFLGVLYHGFVPASFGFEASVRPPSPSLPVRKLSAQTEDSVPALATEVKIKTIKLSDKAGPKNSATPHVTVSPAIRSEVTQKINKQVAKKLARKQAKKQQLEVMKSNVMETKAEDKQVSVEQAAVLIVTTSTPTTTTTTTTAAPATATAAAATKPLTATTVSGASSSEKKKNAKAEPTAVKQEEEVVVMAQQAAAPAQEVAIADQLPPQQQQQQQHEETVVVTEEVASCAAANVEAEVDATSVVTERGDSDVVTMKGCYDDLDEERRDDEERGWVPNPPRLFERTSVTIRRAKRLLGLELPAEDSSSFVDDLDWDSAPIDPNVHLPPFMKLAPLVLEEPSPRDLAQQDTAASIEPVRDKLFFHREVPEFVPWKNELASPAASIHGGVYGFNSHKKPASGVSKQIHTRLPSLALPELVNPGVPWSPIRTPCKFAAACKKPECQFTHPVVTWFPAPVF